MVSKMVASKLLGIVGIFMMANYAAVNGRCWKARTPTAPTASAATTEEKLPCPPTWSQWQDKCYMIHDAEVTWEEGKQICVGLGGVMVIPQSGGETQHLHSMCSCVWFWIGCNDIEDEGIWVCLDGTTDVNDEIWAASQPNGRVSNEDCAASNMPISSGWYDLDCGNTHKLICQRPVSTL